MKNKYIKNIRIALLEFWAENKIRTRICREKQENKKEFENAICAGVFAFVFGGLGIELLFSTPYSFLFTVFAAIFGAVLYYLIFTSENEKAKRFQDYIDQKLDENEKIEERGTCSEECLISIINADLLDRDIKKFEVLSLSTRSFYFAITSFIFAVITNFELISKKDISGFFDVIKSEPALILFFILSFLLIYEIDRIEVNFERNTRKQLKILRRKKVRKVFEKADDMLKEYLEIQDYEIMNTIQKIHVISLGFKDIISAYNKILK